MNAYKLNGIAGHIFRKSVCEKLNISFSEIYKAVASISWEGVITTKEGKKYKLELKEIE